MFTADLSGLNRLIAQLEQRKLDYQVALDSAVDLAKSTILNRVNLGQLVDGSFRTSSNPFRKVPFVQGRYSRRQFFARNKAGLSVKQHNLNFTGKLHKNFVIDKRDSKTLFVRNLGFTSRIVTGKTITYAELAQIQEDKTGIGFQLSPSQLIRVMARFKQVARL